MGMTRRISQNINPEFHPLLLVAAGGAALIACGILCQLIQIFVSIRDREQNRDLTGDPWGARTLEWSTSSPPPFYNFAVVPQIHDRDEFWDMKEKAKRIRNRLNTNRFICLRTPAPALSSPSSAWSSVSQ
jgi:Heme/copper-type cytochrome/quinol oxidases, subunit 1